MWRAQEGGSFSVGTKNHSDKLHAPNCGKSVPNSVGVARYAALIRNRFSTVCDAHLAESIFRPNARRVFGLRNSEMTLPRIFTYCNTQHTIHSSQAAQHVYRVQRYHPL
ncbi:DUF6783 domain-containing protein [Blautia massiliensis (ex Durand et al. 2017)]|uniref:DUF6783 domain-containing protein n=1 Tax=Blautia massiliensis (ex Durand et al. 2017) TaxID=1737424 RepID=UPI002FE6CE56